jgi:hypothetical protein
VSDFSSAHVYVRLPRGRTFEDLPQEVIEDCAQLVKANSIQGSILLFNINKINRSRFLIHSSFSPSFLSLSLSIVYTLINVQNKTIHIGFSF